MDFYPAIFFCLTSVFTSINAVEVPFDQNYVADWGGDHVIVLDQGRQVQIKIDQNSGGGFRSKFAYSSGYFVISFKLPQNAKGTTTTFYLTSLADNAPAANHDELDFELLGNNGPPYTLNTNIFVQDSGHREQQFKLWFDPTSDFHDYEILWNQHQIVFYVDKIPIRVHKNNTNTGARYPKFPLYVHASLWNNQQWLGRVDWRRGPFLANYRGFEIHGCFSNTTNCDSPDYDWNAPRNWQLDPQQQRTYEDIRNRSMTYDYCKANLDNLPEC